MAEKIRFCKTEMEKAVQDIQQKAEELRKAGNLFSENMVSELVGWEGPSKEKFVQFINGAVHTHLTEDIPKLVEGLAQMLQSNYTQMNKADEDMASQLPTTLVQ